MGIDTRITFFKKEKDKLIPLLLKDKDILSDEEIIEQNRKQIDFDLFSKKVKMVFYKRGFEILKNIEHSSEADVINYLIDADEKEKKELLELGEKGYKLKYEKQRDFLYNIELKKIDKIKRIKNVYETEFYSNQQASLKNIKEAVGENNVICASPENTPPELYIDYKYNAYYLPIVINLGKLINSESIQYDRKEQHYYELYEKIINYYPELVGEKLDNYYVVIESF